MNSTLQKQAHRERGRVIAIVMATQLFVQSVLQTKSPSLVGCLNPPLDRLWSGQLLLLIHLGRRGMRPNSHTLPEQEVSQPILTPNVKSKIEIRFRFRYPFFSMVSDVFILSGRFHANCNPSAEAAPGV